MKVALQTSQELLLGRRAPPSCVDNRGPKALGTLAHSRLLCRFALVLRTFGGHTLDTLLVLFGLACLFRLCRLLGARILRRRATEKGVDDIQG